MRSGKTRSFHFTPFHFVLFTCIYATLFPKRFPGKWSYLSRDPAFMLAKDGRQGRRSCLVGWPPSPGGLWQAQSIWTVTGPLASAARWTPSSHGKGGSFGSAAGRKDDCECKPPRRLHAWPAPCGHFVHPCFMLGCPFVLKPKHGS